MKKSLGAKRIEAFLLAVMLCIMCIWGNNAVASAESDAEVTITAQEDYSEEYAVAEDSAVEDAAADDAIAENVDTEAVSTDVITDSEVVGADGVYTITYVLDGGVNDSRNPSTYTVKDNYVMIYPPTKDGYEFVQWSTKGFTLINRTTYVYFAGSIAKDCTFTAVWKAKTGNPEFTINFDGNGATSGSMDPIKTYGTSKTIDLPECQFKKEGYMFTGWSDGRGNNSITTSYTFLDLPYTVTLKALWKEINGFYVGFDTLSQEMDEVLYIYDTDMKKMQLPAPPEEDGYRFMGWYADSDFKNMVVTYGDLERYAVGKSYVTVYGSWERISSIESVLYNFTMDQDLYFSVLFQVDKIPTGMYYTLGDRTVYVADDDVDEYIFEKKLYKRLKIKVKPTQVTWPITLFDPSGGDDGRWWGLSFDRAYKDTVNEPVKSIVNAILDYCAYTRLYYGDDMGTNTVPDFEQTISRVSAVKAEDLANYEYYIESYDENIEYLGSSLLSENRIGIRHYFKIQDTSVARGSTALIDGEAVALIPAGGNIYYIQLDGIAPVEFSNMNTISIGNLTLNYGVYSYVKGALEVENCGAYLQSLCKAIYSYGEAARKLQA